MTTSVAMCTYNGAQFIEEQLRSIITQTMPVGEIVVCDDRSTDNTIEIIQNISQETNVPIHIHINETNLGCVRNFEKAIRLCQGDIIFLSDQDDIWMQNKVETVIAWFEEHPQMNVVFGDAILIDENGNPIMKSQVPDILVDNMSPKDEPVRLWECMVFSELSQKQVDLGLGFELWLRQNRATGATMAFKRDFSNTIRIDYSNKDIYLYHDFVLSFEALLTSTLGYMVQPVVYYRQHTKQAIGCLWLYSMNQGNDDARVCARCWTDLSVFPLNNHFMNRLSFYKKRLRFKYSFLAIAVLCNVYTYVKTYGELWKQLFCYDYKISILHNIKRMKKLMRIIYGYVRKSPI